MVELARGSAGLRHSAATLKLFAITILLLASGAETRRSRHRRGHADTEIWFNRQSEYSFALSGVLDGVYRRTEGEPDFQEARAPSRDELSVLLEKIIARLLKMLIRLGHLVTYRVGIETYRTPAELISTLSRLVREKKLTRADYRKLKGAAMADLADADICQITPGILGSAIALLESHPLWAMDALHVACALAVKPDIFVSADRRQLSAARKAGLKTVDVS